MEKYVEKARHIEVQVFGDGTGLVVHLGDRECSIQVRTVRDALIREQEAGLCKPSRCALGETALLWNRGPCPGRRLMLLGVGRSLAWCVGDVNMSHESDAALA